MRDIHFAAKEPVLAEAAGTEADRRLYEATAQMNAANAKPYYYKQHLHNGPAQVLQVCGVVCCVCLCVRVPKAL